MPLDAKGEAQKYPHRFGDVGAEFEARACANDQELLKLARDAVITVGSIRPIPGAVIRGLERCRVASVHPSAVALTKRWVERSLVTVY